MLGIGYRTLTPGTFEVPPWLASKPAISVRARLRAVLAELIDDRCAAHDCLEPRGLPFHEASHLAPVAIADQCNSLCIDWRGAKHFINTRHNVEVVSVAHVILIGRFKFNPVPSTSARVRDQHSPSLSNQKIGERRVGIGELPSRTAMNIDNQRHAPL